MGSHSPQAKFLYQRHLDSPLVTNKIDYYRAHPERWSNRYRFLPHEALQDVTSGFCYNTPIFPWIESQIHSVANDKIKVSRQDWQKTLRIVKDAITLQAKASFGKFPNFSIATLDQYCNSLVNNLKVINSYFLKGQVLGIHHELNLISRNNIYPASLPSLPNVLIDTDMVYFTKFPGGGLIVPFTFFLSVLDKCEAQFAFHIYCSLATLTKSKEGLDFYSFSLDLYNRLDAIYYELGNQAIDVFKMLEPITLGVCLEALPSSTNDCDFLNRQLEDLQAEKPLIHSYVRVLTDFFREYRNAHGERGFNCILEQYGQEKLHFYPIVDIEGGLIKMFRYGTAQLPVDISFTNALVGSFIKCYIVSYYNLEGHLPLILWLPDYHPVILSILTTGNPQSMTYCNQVPDDEWAKIVFRKHYEYNYYPNILELLDDKSISPHRHFVDQLFAHDALQELGRRALSIRENTRLVKEILTRSEISIQDYFNTVESLGHFPPEWSIIQLLPKERELKIFARMFSVLAFEPRMMCSSTEHNLSESILKYFKQQTMTASGPELQHRVDNLSQFVETSEYIWVSFVIDLEQWNYAHRQGLQLPFLKILNQMFGVRHFHTVSQLFMESTIFSGDKFCPPGTEGQFHQWNSHVGGNQGIFQKFWTLITISIIRQVMLRLDFEHILIGSGDNQVVSVKIRKNTDIVNSVDLIRTELSESFTKSGLTLKLSETWHSSQIFCYQRKYYFKGVQIATGIKQGNRAFAGGSDVDSGISSTISTAMNSGLNIAQTTTSPYIGVLFAYLESYAQLMLDPNVNRILPFDTRVMSLLSCVNTSFGYLPFMQLPSFSYTGTKDVLVESFSILKNIWILMPGYRSAIACLIRWDRAALTDINVTQLVLDPQNINIIKSKNVETYIRQAVEEHLNSPGIVKNTQIRNLLNSAQAVDRTKYMKHLLNMRPIHSSLIHQILETSTVGQLLSIMAKFDRISTLVQWVGLNHTKKVGVSFQDKVKEFDVNMIRYITRRTGRGSSLQPSFEQQLLGGTWPTYIDFCTQHQLEPHCTFSCRLFLTSYTHGMLPEMIHGPFSPSPIEQLDPILAPSQDELCQAIHVTPVLLCEDNIPDLDDTRGPCPLYLGSATADPIRSLRLTSVNVLPIGRALQTLIKMYTWLRELNSNYLALSLITTQIKSRAPSLLPYLEFMQGGSAGGTFLHRFESTGQIVGAYRSSASMISTWYSLSTNAATSLHRGEEDRYIFFQALFHHIYAAMRFCLPITNKYYCIVNFNHCGYLLHNLQFTHDQVLVQQDPMHLEFLAITDSQAKLIETEARHNSLLKGLSNVENIDPANLLCATVAHDFAVNLHSYQMSQKIGAESRQNYTATSGVYNITVLRKVSTHNLLSHIFVHICLLGALGSNRNPSRVARILRIISGKQSGIQDIVPYRNLLDALITAGHLDELIRLSRSNYSCQSSNVFFPLLGIFLKALSNVGRQVLIKHPPLCLLIEAKRSAFNWDSLWSFLTYWSSRYSQWKAKTPCISIALHLAEFNKYCDFLSICILADKGVAVEVGRRNLQLMEGPQQDQQDTIHTSIREITRIVCPFPAVSVTSHHDNVESIDMSQLQFIQKYLDDVKGSFIEEELQVSHWYSTSSTASLKLLSILSDLLLDKTVISLVVSLGEGDGSFLSLLLHQFPKSRGVYASLIGASDLPQCYSGNFVPPATVCQCNIQSKVQHSVNTARKSGDLSYTESWEELTQFYNDEDSKTGILTMDCQVDQINRATLLDYFVHHCENHQFDLVVLKTSVLELQSPSALTLFRLCQLYHHARLMKPHGSNMVSLEIYLVLQRRSVTNMVSHSFDFLLLTQKWINCVNNQRIQGSIQYQCQLSSWVVKSNLCNVVYPSTGTINPPSTHPITHVIFSCIELLQLVLGLSFHQKSKMDKTTLHMIHSISSGADITLGTSATLIELALLILLCLSFTGGSLRSNQITELLLTKSKLMESYFNQSLHDKENLVLIKHGYQFIGEVFSSTQDLDGGVTGSGLWYLKVLLDTAPILVLKPFSKIIQMIEGSPLLINFNYLQDHIYWGLFDIQSIYDSFYFFCHLINSRVVGQEFGLDCDMSLYIHLIKQLPLPISWNDKSDNRILIINTGLDQIDINSIIVYKYAIVFRPQAPVNIVNCFKCIATKEFDYYKGFSFICLYVNRK
ncbi:RNA-dependent RNA polymerase [Beihai rhabdo-like virus 1]|uniref:RNA-directed RNA polymerase n=1 Tax=Beihai rhabdo-like virus 1 TaxID=1922651 RepID=A0A1L3KMR0_9MONO|nr:RNA-dependent RNA polymerase [Beihai rhabdo-like virus 1]APG78668.1 RNA-dependent RNA polymerase [Beihai rhabdo-like virus 1]